MDEDEILGSVTILFVIGCGLLNLFCSFYRPSILYQQAEEPYAYQDIV